MSLPILVIEDDYGIIEIVRASISSLGIEVEHETDGKDGLALALSRDFSALILDVNLPGLNGFEICRRIREKKPALPIMMLTSRTDEVDKVLGLELGADDYLGKPFSVREFTARVNALLRRAHCAVSPSTISGSSYCSNGLCIDFERRKVTKNDAAVQLTALEFDILAFLAAHAGRPFTREQIVDNVWQYRAANYQKSVTVLINRIRSKIEADPDQPEFILTERGVGYRLREPD